MSDKLSSAGFLLSERQIPLTGAYVGVPILAAITVLPKQASASRLEELMDYNYW